MANRRFQPLGADYTDLSGRYSMSRGPSDTLMDRIAEFRNRQRATTKAVTLAILMIIMDMSGLSGVYAGDQEELDERQEKRGTLSNLNMPGFQSGLASTNQTFDIGESGQHACMVLDDQSLWCWGYNGHYGLGQLNSTDSENPIPVYRDSGWAEQTVAVSLGFYHNCELLTFGTVQCWGQSYPAGAQGPLSSDTASQLQNSPSPVTLDSAAVLVDSGRSHSCAILDNGSVQCWGSNQYGQLGVGYQCVTGNEGVCGVHNNEIQSILYPAYAILPAGRTAVGLNLFHYSTCIILDDGSYVCAGVNFGSASTPFYLNDSEMHIDFADSYTAVDGGDLLYVTSNYDELERTQMRYGGARTPHFYQQNTSYIYAVEGGVRALAGATANFDQSFEQGCILLLNNSLGCGRNHYGPHVRRCVVGVVEVVGHGQLKGSVA